MDKRNKGVSPSTLFMFLDNDIPFSEDSYAAAKRLLKGAAETIADMSGQNVAERAVDDVRDRIIDKLIDALANR